MFIPELDFLHIEIIFFSSIARGSPPCQCHTAKEWRASKKKRAMQRIPALVAGMVQLHHTQPSLPYAIYPAL